MPADTTCAVTENTYALWSRSLRDISVKILPLLRVDGTLAYRASEKHNIYFSCLDCAQVFLDPQAPAGLHGFCGHILSATIETTAMPPPLFTP